MRPEIKQRDRQREYPKGRQGQKGRQQTVRVVRTVQVTNRETRLHNERDEVQGL